MGRPKGAENKHQFCAEQLAAEMGVDPLRFLLEVVRGDHPEHERDRVKAATAAARYIHSEKQSIAHTTGDEGFRVVIEEYCGNKNRG